MLKSDLGNLGGKDRILDGENTRAGDAKEELIFDDVLRCNLRVLAGVYLLGRWRVRVWVRFGGSTQDGQ